MNKTLFLKNLKDKLKWKLNRNESLEILSDYDGFFSDGISDEKSDNQVCLELGDPEVIANELSIEMQRSSFFYLIHNWKLLVVTSIFSLFTWFAVSNYFNNIQIIGFAIFIIILFSIILNDLTKTKILNKYSFSLHILLISLTIISYILCYNPIALLNSGFFSPANIGLFYTYILRSIVLIAFIIVVHELYKKLNLNKTNSSLLYHSIAVIVYVSYLFKVLSNMSSIQGYESLIIVAPLVYTGIFSLGLFISSLIIWIRKL